MPSDPTPKSAAPRTPGSRTTPVLVPQGVLAGQPDIPLNRPVTTVGSGEQARLHLVSRTVSKAHALFVNSNGGTYVADLVSRTGVLINGKLVKDGDLKTGDRVQIGKFVFRYRAPAATGSAPGSAESPSASVIMVGSPAVQVDRRAVVIGRRDTCDFALTNDAGVSASHAVIFQMDGKWYLRDLASRTGTNLNGKAIHQAEVKFGDRIAVGSATILFQPGSSATVDDLDDSGVVEIVRSSPLEQEEETETAPLADALADWKSAFPPAEEEVLPAAESELAVEPEAVVDEAPLPVEEVTPEPLPIPQPAGEVSTEDFDFFSEQPEPSTEDTSPPVAAAPVAAAPVIEDFDFAAPESTSESAALESVVEPLAEEPVAPAEDENAIVDADLLPLDEAIPAPAAPLPGIETPAAPPTATPAPVQAPQRSGPSMFGFDFEGGSFVGGMPLPLLGESPAPEPVEEPAIPLEDASLLAEEVAGTPSKPEAETTAADIVPVESVEAEPETGAETGAETDLVDFDLPSLGEAIPTPPAAMPGIETPVERTACEAVPAIIAPEVPRELLEDVSDFVFVPESEAAPDAGDLIFWGDDSASVVPPPPPKPAATSQNESSSANADQSNDDDGEPPSASPAREASTESPMSQIAAEEHPAEVPFVSADENHADTEPTGNGSLEQVDTSAPFEESPDEPSSMEDEPAQAQGSEIETIEQVDSLGDSAGDLFTSTWSGPTGVHQVDIPEFEPLEDDYPLPSSENLEAAFAQAQTWTATEIAPVELSDDALLDAASLLPEISEGDLAATINVPEPGAVEETVAPEVSDAPQTPEAGVAEATRAAGKVPENLEPLGESVLAAEPELIDATEAPRRAEESTAEPGIDLADEPPAAAVASATPEASETPAEPEHEPITLEQAESATESEAEPEPALVELDSIDAIEAPPAEGSTAEPGIDLADDSPAAAVASATPEISEPSIQPTADLELPEPVAETEDEFEPVDLEAIEHEAEPVELEVIEPAAEVSATEQSLAEAAHEPVADAELTEPATESEHEAEPVELEVIEPAAEVSATEESFAEATHEPVADAELTEPVTESEHEAEPVELEVIEPAAEVSATEESLAEAKQEPAADAERTEPATESEHEAEPVELEVIEPAAEVSATEESFAEATHEPVADAELTEPVTESEHEAEPVELEATDASSEVPAVDEPVDEATPEPAADTELSELDAEAEHEVEPVELEAIEPAAELPTTEAPLAEAKHEREAGGISFEPLEPSVEDAVDEFDFFNEAEAAPVAEDHSPQSEPVQTAIEPPAHDEPIAQETRAGLEDLVDLEPLEAPSNSLDLAAAVASATPASETEPVSETNDLESSITETPRPTDFAAVATSDELPEDRQEDSITLSEELAAKAPVHGTEHDLDFLDEHPAPAAEASAAPPVPPQPVQEAPARAPAQPDATRRGPSLFGFDFEGGSFLGGMPISLSGPPPAPKPPAAAAAPPIPAPSRAFDVSATRPSGLNAMLPPAPAPAQVKAVAEAPPRLSQRPITPPPPARPAAQQGVSLSGLISDFGPGVGAPIIPPVARTGPVPMPRGLTGANKVAPPRNTEVFSQLETPIGVEVFGGRPGDPNKFVVPEVEKPTEEVKPQTEAPAPQPVVPLKVRWSRLPVWIALIPLSAAGAWFGTHTYLKESATLKGQLPYAQMSGLPVDSAELVEFHKGQEQLLFSEPVRLRAMQILMAANKPVEFTGDPESYVNMVRGKDSFTSDSLELQLSWSGEIEGRSLLNAVLQALAEKDKDLLDSAHARALADDDAANARVKALDKQRAELVTQQREQAQLAQDRPDTESVTRNSQDLSNLTVQWQSAVTKRTNTEAILAQVKAQDPTKPVDPDKDREMIALKAQLQPLLDEIQRARTRGGVSTTSPPGAGADVSVGAATQPDGDQSLQQVLQDQADKLQAKVKQRQAELDAESAIPVEQRVVNQQKWIENLSIDITTQQNLENQLKKKLDDAKQIADDNAQKLKAASVADARKEDLNRQINQNDDDRKAANETLGRTRAALEQSVTVAGDPAITRVSITDLSRRIFVALTVFAWATLALLIWGELRRPKLIQSVRPTAAPLVNPPVRLVPWPKPPEKNAAPAEDQPVGV